MHPKIKFFLPEAAVRVVLLGITSFLNAQRGTETVIQPEEWWRYKQETKPCILEMWHFLAIGSLAPTLVVIIFYSVNRNDRDLVHALLAFSLGICLTTAITSLLKMSAGRPRPNFLICCFPDGQIKSECTGDPDAIDSGRKSFPSGHTSFAFVSMTFLFLYLSAKLNLFNELGLGQSWRICVCLAPIMAAIMTGVLRTTHNKHHPEDVVAGGIIGSVIAYLCYRQRFPSIYAPNPGKPYEFLNDPFDAR